MTTTTYVNVRVTAPFWVQQFHFDAGGKTGMVDVDRFGVRVTEKQSEAIIAEAAQHDVTVEVVTD